jgi:hypothetical protein
LCKMVLNLNYLLIFMFSTVVNLKSSLNLACVTVKMISKVRKIPSETRSWTFLTFNPSQDHLFQVQPPLRLGLSKIVLAAEIISRSRCNVTFSINSSGFSCRKNLVHRQCPTYFSTSSPKATLVGYKKTACWCHTRNKLNHMTKWNIL